MQIAEYTTTTYIIMENIVVIFIMFVCDYWLRIICKTFVCCFVSHLRTPELQARPPPPVSEKGELPQSR